MRSATNVAVAVLLLGLACGAAFAEVPSGFSIGVGMGVFAAQDADVYMGLGADLYPEAKLLFDVSAVRVGASAGLVYRKQEAWSWGYSSSYEETTILYTPLQAELALYPLRFGLPHAKAQPYVGGGVGAFVPFGDSYFTDPRVCASGHVGLDIFPSRWVVINVDASYTWASGDRGGFIVTAGARFRIPLTK